MVETVVFPTLSGSAQGQFVAPAAPGPGLLLLPDVNGLAPWLLARAERLAGAGVWTLVVDLLGGQGTWSDGVEDNASRFLARDLAEVAHDINGAARFLLDQPQVTGDTVAVSGDDGGGALALWAATVSPRIGAASAVYPARILGASKASDRRRSPAAIPSCIWRPTTPSSAGPTPQRLQRSVGAGVRRRSTPTQGPGGGS
jgi:dienelactone hydrolase